MFKECIHNNKILMMIMIIKMIPYTFLIIFKKQDLTVHKIALGASPSKER